jgi:hypothetical protein
MTRISSTYRILSINAFPILVSIWLDLGSFSQEIAVRDVARMTIHANGAGHARNYGASAFDFHQKWQSSTMTDTVFPVCDSQPSNNVLWLAHSCVLLAF